MTDAKYTKYRNELISEAVQYANTQLNIDPIKKFPVGLQLVWTKIYLKRMSYLAVNEGLCDPRLV